MRWKWILRIAVILIVALIVTAYVILSSYDFNNLKPRIAQAAKNATGRELTLGGDIDLEIGFSPTLVVEDVSFQNAPWGSRPELAKIKHIEVQVVLLSLIRGRIEIKRLVLVEPDILIETDSSGRANLTFETVKKAKPGEQEEKDSAERDKKMPALTFNELRVEKGRFTYRDGQSGETYAVKLASLTAAAAGADSPIDLALMGGYNDQPFEVEGTLGPLVVLTDPDEAWPLNLKAKSGGATVTLDGTIKDVLRGKGLALSLLAEGQSISNVATLAGVTGVPDVGPFEVVIEVADPSGKLTMEKLDVDVGTEGLAKVKLTGTIKDPLAQRGVELKFAARGKDLANLKRFVSQPLPLKGPFEISGHIVDLPAKTYKVSDLKVVLGDSDLGGSVEVSLAGKRPKVTAMVSSQRADLRPFLAKEADTGNAVGHHVEPTVKRDKVFPDEPLPLDALTLADATVKIRAGQILLPQLVLNDFTVDMVLEDGRLTVKPLKAIMGGGTLNANFDLIPQEKIAVLMGASAIDQLDVGRLLKELKATDVIEGKLDIDLDLKSQGDSIASLMAALDAKITVEQGHIAYKDAQSGKTYAVTSTSLMAAAAGADSPVEMVLKGTFNDSPFEAGGILGPLAALLDPNEAWRLNLKAKAGGATVAVDGTIKDVLHGKGLVLTLIAEGQSISDVAKLAEMTGVTDVGPFKATVEVADPGGKLTVEKLDVDVGTEDLAKVKITGAIEDPLAQRGVELDFSARGKDLENLERLVGQPLPHTGPFEISGHVMDPVVKTYKVSNLKVVLSDSDLGGSLEVSLAGKRPKVTAVVSSQRADLRPFLAKEAKTGNAVAQPVNLAIKHHKIFPDEPLPLDALTLADATVKIRAGQILLPQLAVNDLTVGITLKEGHLTVEPLKAVMGGGTLNGRLDLQQDEKVAVLAARLKIDRLDLGRMLKELKATDVIEGKLDIDLDLKSQGDSIASLMAALDTKITVEQGHIAYKDAQSGKTYAVTSTSLMAAAAGADSPVEMVLKGAFNDNPFEAGGILGPLAALLDPNEAWPLNLKAKAGGATVTVDGAIKDALHAKGLSLTVIAEGQSIPDVAKLAGVTGVPDVGPFKVVIEMADPSGNLTMEKLDIDVGTEDLAKVKITGAIEDPLAQRGVELDFAARGKDLGNLEPLVGQPLPLKGRFELSGHVMDRAVKTYKVSDLKVVLGDSGLGGSVEVNLAGERPRITTVLSSQRLDLRPMLAEGKDTSGGRGQRGQAAVKEDNVFPDDPLPLDALKQADADVKIRAGQVLLPRLVANDLTLNILLENGHLTVQPLKAAISSSTLDGRLDLQLDGMAAVVAAALQIDQLDLGYILGELEVSDFVEGRVDVEVDLRGRGESIASLMAGLNAKISATQGHASYEDAQSGKTYEVSLENLTTVVAGAENPVELAVRGACNNQPFELAGTLGALATMADPNEAWPLNLKAKAGGAIVTVDGAIRDALNGKGVALTVIAEGKSIPDVARLADLTDLPDAGPFKVAAQLADPGGKLTVEKLDVDVGTEDLAKVKLTGAIEDPLAQRGIELEFAARGKDLGNLERLVGQPLPHTGPFDVSGRAVDLAAKTYKVSDLKVVLGDSDLGGSLEVSLAGNRPRLTAALSSQRLDLRPFLAKEADTRSAVGQAVEQATERDMVFPNEPLPLDALTLADAIVKIRARQIILPQLALLDLTAEMVLEDGHLTVKPLEAIMGGGTLDGHFALRPQDKVAELSGALKVEQFDVGPMLKELEVTDVIEGKLDIDLDLKSQGDSIASLMAGPNAKISVTQGHGSYEDAQSGKTYELSLESLTIVVAGAENAVELAARGACNNQPFELAGTLGPLAALLDPNEAWPLNLKAKAGGATVTVDGEISDALHGKGLALTVIAEGQSIPDVAKLAEVTGVPDVGPFKVLFELADPGGKLTVEKLDVDVGTEDLAKVKLTGAIEDPLAQRGIELVFAARGKNLGTLEQLVGKPMPLTGPFEISGRAVDLAVKTYKVSDLKVVLGDSDLGGSLKVSLDGKRPRLTAALSSLRLDFRPLLPKRAKTLGAAGQRSVPGAKQEKVFSDDRLPLDALNQADAVVRIRAGQILLPRLALRDLTADVVLDEGQLAVKPVEAVIGGGTLDGRFALRPQDRVAVLSAVFEIDRLDLGRMLKELEVTDVIEGKLDIDLDLKGRGDSVAALMAGLEGKTSMVMGKGRIENKYIDLLGADLSSGVFRLLNPYREEGKYTEVNCLVSGFDIEDGLAYSTALVFDTSQMSVVGDGMVNLKTEELSLSLKPSPKKGVGTSGVGKVSLGLGELAKPFKLGGTLANPSLAIDATQTAITLGKAVGGVVLFGPVGIAAALISRTSADENPCLAAIEAAQKGVTVSGPQRPEEKKGVAEKATEGVTKGVKGTVEGIGKKLKKLFRK